jgi:hypothetical protein
MSELITAPEITATEALEVITETTVYAVTKNESGKLGFSVLKESPDPSDTDQKAGNALAKSIASGKVELIQKIEVTAPIATTIAGFSKIIADEDEVVAIFNTGLDQRVTNKLRTYFLEQNEAGDFLHADVTTFDATEFAAEPLKRKSLSPEQKAVRDLKGYSAETLTAALKAMGIL